MTLDDLARSRCHPCKGKQDAMNDEDIQRLVGALPGWQLASAGQGIEKEFRFDDFHRTMAFVNAVAWIAHSEDHHPDMKVSYPSCKLYFATHDVGGLSRNDFICAAKVERLFGCD
ncbi:MAG: 4a-hydroxytetrahydrobiopterin dehydratase [Xanthomonadales bacterium]|nr:4a-hydroxytetrahydrobiopterin dehydratase [Xanthomonadales bacterium]